MGQTLKVAIVGDATSYARALNKASGETSSFGKSLATLGKFAVLGLGAAGVGGALLTLKRGFSEVAESQKVMAQTEAALASTGKAANISAKQVEELATSISLMSGIDDEAVQAGENMLLTFTGVRNELGKGNDIFNQATLAVSNFATRMNQGAVPSSEQMAKASILVGKALNDPIKGYTKLQRAGVLFTDTQVKQIKALEASGHTMEAQKIILAELTKEFGGSAKAAGTTLPGQLNKLKNAFDELSGQVVSTLAPALSGALSTLTKFIQRLGAAGGLKAKIVVAAKFVWSGLTGAVSALQKEFSDLLFGSFQKGGGVGPEGIKFDEGLVAKFRDALAKLDWTSVGNSIIDGITNALSKAGEFVKRIAATVEDAVSKINWEAVGQQMGPGLAAAIAVAFTTLTDPAFWVRHWDLALAIMLTVFGGSIGKIAGKLIAPFAKLGGDMMLGLLKPIEALSPRLASALLTGLTAAGALLSRTLGGFAGIAGAALRGLETVVRTVFGRLGSIAVFIVKILGVQAAINAAVQVGKSIVDAVSRGTANLVGAVTDAFRKLWEWIKGAAGSAYAFAFRIGSQIVQGLISGLGDIAKTVGSKLKDGVEKALHYIDPRNLKPWSPVSHWATLLGIELTRDVKAVYNILGPALSKQLTAALKSAGAAGLAAGKDIGAPVLKGLNNVGQLIVAAAKKYGVDARAALAVAMGEGGIKFGAVGDSGHAFGPFQFNNAGGVATGKSAAEASAWANSAKGVADAIRMMADAGAKGKVGLDAITAIVRNFERPLDPSGSIRKAAEAYKTLGPQIATSIATGTGAVKTSVANQLSALVGLVKEFAPQIGIEHVRGIIAGLVGKTPDIVAAAKAQMEKIVAAMAAAAQARTELKDAFKALAQGALSAFDAVTDAWVPPAQKLLDKMQLEDQINAAVGAVAEAQARIDAAVNTRDTLTRSEGESDADFAARIAQAEADIKSATEQLGAAQRSYDELQLGLRAAAQKAAHDKQREADREALAADLLMLQTELDKHPEAYAATQRKIIALMKKYHVPLFTAGQKLAQAFSDGLDDGIAAVAATARKLAAALEAIPGVGKSSGSGGGGVDPNSYGERGGGLPGGTSSGRGTAAMNITVNMPNYLGDKREAARTIRDEIVRINRDSAITA